MSRSERPFQGRNRVLESASQGYALGWSSDRSGRGNRTPSRGDGCVAVYEPARLFPSASPWTPVAGMERRVLVLEASRCLSLKGSFRQPRPKAWAHFGNSASGPVRAVRCAHTVDSIPDIAFVPIDLVSPQPFSQLVLERLLRVMLRLTPDVLSHRVDVRLTYGKDRITRLPVKLGH